MIELPPKLDNKTLNKVFIGKSDIDANLIVDKINEDYDYWDKVKYKPLPNGYNPTMLWSHVKASRYKGRIPVWDKYGINLCVTNHMQRICHEFDMIFGSFWEADSAPDATEKMRYLASSLMEEAIYSSQMEGASTTRAKAKEMLKKGISPRDKSQQMIVNNYQTIQYITKHKDDPMTEERLLQIHRLMTENTLKDSNNSGRFRTNSDDVVVENKITHEIVHTPPPADDLPQFIQDLCNFFNNENNRIFIHPIIRGIIIHFMIAYMHPFVDGNGRTARALFYWYMLKEKYWLTEYMSISKVIAKSKHRYEKSFLYTECDELDLGYFVSYNLRVLNLSFLQLKGYIEKKQREKKAANAFILIGNINERQAQIIQYFNDRPNEIVTVKEMQHRFAITAMTARKDLVDLVEKGYLDEISINNVKKGYIRSNDFEEIIANKKR
ncbi:MAG: Fic family protein [Bacteroidales bacterium]|nr:Fic family protein [Bacteroidales bacterium]